MAVVRRPLAKLEGVAARSQRGDEAGRRQRESVGVNRERRR
jgi:hypothetical protein